jgi:hypothetical protein
VLDDGSAWIAYVLGGAHQAARRDPRDRGDGRSPRSGAYGVAALLANVEAENAPSIRLLQRLGFRAATADEAARACAERERAVFVPRAARAGGALAGGVAGRDGDPADGARVPLRSACAAAALAAALVVGGATALAGRRRRCRAADRLHRRPRAISTTRRCSSS